MLKTVGVVSRAMGISSSSPVRQIFYRCCFAGSSVLTGPGHSPLSGWVAAPLYETENARNGDGLAGKADVCFTKAHRAYGDGGKSSVGRNSSIEPRVGASPRRKGNQEEGLRFQEKVHETQGLSRPIDNNDITVRSKEDGVDKCLGGQEAGETESAFLRR